jgi:hypothetical protein
MKILAWMLFGTSVICFAIVFCRQQLDNQMMQDATALGAPSPQWAQIEKQSSDDWPDASTVATAATTQPLTREPVTPSVVAAGDVSDALK